MADLNEIVDSLSSLTIMEAAELASLLEEKWGVSAAAPVAVAAGPVAEAAESDLDAVHLLAEVDATELNAVHVVSQTNAAQLDSLDLLGIGPEPAELEPRDPPIAGGDQGELRAADRGRRTAIEGGQVEPP